MSTDREPGTAAYAAGVMARAFVTALTHEDPSTRTRAEGRVARWGAVLRGLTEGTLRIGNRLPVADLPAWVTLEVLHGGFATGTPATSGPLRPHERELARCDLRSCRGWPRSTVSGATPGSRATTRAPHSSAYAWRQALFFLSMAGPDAAPRFGAQADALATLAPVVDGLRHVLAGGCSIPSTASSAGPPGRTGYPGVYRARRSRDRAPRSPGCIRAGERHGIRLDLAGSATFGHSRTRRGARSLLRVITVWTLWPSSSTVKPSCRQHRGW